VLASENQICYLFPIFHKHISLGLRDGRGARNDLTAYGLKLSNKCESQTMLEIDPTKRAKNKSGSRDNVSKRQHKYTKMFPSVSISCHIHHVEGLL
jgi:hypothetical protein